ncbi:MAG: enoyl-CoA hydratase-related protein, partial [Ilumatobacteraceae bacterium]
MLRTERRPGPVRDVLVVTVDRPERRNALDLTTVRELRAVAGDTTVGAVVLTGAPPAFCAGADLTGVDSEEFGGELSAMLEAWDRWPAVRIAAIDGPALGAGTQLALVCDLRVASAGSEFGIPAARLGLAVDQWTVDRLVDEFGWPVARSILLTAERVDAETLHRIGAIHRLGSLDDAV